MAITNIHIEQFSDVLRTKVLEAIDEVTQEFVNHPKAKGWKDSDLPDLFKGLDAHIQRLAARYNSPESDEYNSAFVRFVPGA